MCSLKIAKSEFLRTRYVFVLAQHILLGVELMRSLADALQCKSHHYDKM